MKYLVTFFSGLLIACYMPVSHGQANNSELEELVVNAEFRDTSLLSLANSVTVIDSARIAARGATHIEQLFGLAPNVNYSSGASRGRFFQIRGVGERSQFVDPVNPSVGLIVDGIDFTGLGLSANTLDIDQVEILRGPQGTLFGANALAGMIYMSGVQPTDTLSGRVSLELAEFDGRTLSAALGGPISDSIQARLAVQHQRSDGFTDNQFLNRNDTNNIDEWILRSSFHATLSENWEADVSVVYLDVDNGYDAFSLENTRSTQSDQPGWDRQESVAGSIRTVWEGTTNLGLSITLTASDSDTEYGYDEDWSFIGFHPFEYTSTDNYRRQSSNASADVQLQSKEGGELFNGRSSWVAGVYARNEKEDLARRDNFFSKFDTQNYAVYGELDTALNDKFSLVTGLRLEQRNADYKDNVGVESDNDETLWGTRISLQYQLNDNQMFYALLSRGYKAGGVNGEIISAAQNNAMISSDVFEFDTESMWNYELGFKGSWLDQRLQTQIAVFLQDRDDVQAKQSIFNPIDFSFNDYLSNAAGGQSLGLEVEFSFAASDSVLVYGAAGLLDAEFKDFTSSSHVDARDDFSGTVVAVDLDGRDVAHAPNYQFLFGMEVSFNDYWYGRLEVEGKDAFFFSNSHNEQSQNYQLWNARAGYRSDSWNVSVWGRNLSDEDYFVRGFYFSNQFGNNPANNYAPETYYQFGEPRIIGVSASYDF